MRIKRPPVIPEVETILNAVLFQSEEVDARRRDRKSHNHHHHHHHQHNSRNHSRHDYEQCSTSPLSAVDNNTPTCQSPPHSSSAANRKQAQHHLHNHDDHELPPPPPNNNSTNHQCCRKVPPSVTIKGNGGGSDVESSLLKNSTLSSSHRYVAFETALDAVIKGPIHATENENTVPYSRIQSTSFQCSCSQYVWNLIQLKRLAYLLYGSVASLSTPTSRHVNMARHSSSLRSCI